MHYLRSCIWLDALSAMHSPATVSDYECLTTSPKECILNKEKNITPIQPRQGRLGGSSASRISIGSGAAHVTLCQKK